MDSRKLCLLSLGLGASGACAGPEPLCDADELRSALAGAQSGDVLELGDCEVTGPFELPAGVQLVGQGESSVIAAPALGVGVTLAADTRLAELRVESAGAAGIVARNANGASIEQVTISATAGIGIGAEDAEDFSLSAVSLTGPVTAASVGQIPEFPSVADTALFGLAMFRGSALLSDVTVSGFGGSGIVALGAVLDWQGGSADDNAQTGLIAAGGSVSLASVTLDRSLQAPGGRTAYGGVLVGDVYGGTLADAGDLEFSASGLSASDNEGVGLLVAAASSVGIDGAAFDGDAGIGLWIRDSADVTVDGGSFSGTSMATLLLGEEDAPLELGDGIQLVNSSEGIAITGSTVADNARVGLLIDLGPVDAGDFEHTWDLSVDAQGDAFGARCQGSPDGTPESWPPGDDAWDDGIVRTGAAVTNDETVSTDDVATVAGVVNPCNFSAPEGILAGGLAGLNVP